MHMVARSRLVITDENMFQHFFPFCFDNLLDMSNAGVRVILPVKQHHIHLSIYLQFESKSRHMIQVLFPV